MFGPISKRRTTMAVVPQDDPTPVGEPKVQTSHILPRLARRLASQSKPRILDLGSVMSGNLQFFIDLGCKVTVDNLLKPVDPVRDLGSAAPDWKPGTSRRLEYSDATFDAVIVWDTFDFLSSVEARDFAKDLLRVMKPGGIVMAYFTSREIERREPARRFRILAQERIEWIPINTSRTLRHVYQNRDIERMFEGFKTFSAYVLQNGTREMLLEKKPPSPAASTTATSTAAPAGGTGTSTPTPTRSTAR